MTVPEIFAAALAHHQAGRFREAEAGYRQVLAREPKHAMTLQLLGLIAHQTGNPAAALELIQQAIKLQGDIPEFHHNAAQVLETLGRPDEAILSYRRALQFNPNLSPAHESLGMAAARLERFEESAQHFDALV